jgi:hypothetical protein
MDREHVEDVKKKLALSKEARKKIDMAKQSDSRFKVKTVSLVNTSVRG